MSSRNHESNCSYMSIEDIWESEVITWLSRVLSTRWDKIGITTEVEARLGKMTDHGFESGVKSKFFYAMRDYLKSRNYWTDENGNSIHPKVDDEFAVLFDDKVRVVTTYDGKDYKVVEVIRKNPIDKQTFDMGEAFYALRLSTAEERPMTENESRLYSNAALAYLQKNVKNDDYRVVLIRHRERISFNYNNEYHIDMTMVQSSSSIQTVQSQPTIYEVECELGVPRCSQNRTLFNFMQAILHRMYTQPESIYTPPLTSIYHQNTLTNYEREMYQPARVMCDLLLESSEGYDDGLICWCKEHNPEGRPILPLKVAQKLNWCFSNPRFLLTLNGKTIPYETSPENTLKVINCGGTIRTEDGKSFHCCVWQYEGILLNPPSASIKRPISVNVGSEAAKRRDM